MQPAEMYHSLLPSWGCPRVLIKDVIVRDLINNLTCSYIQLKSICLQKAEGNNFVPSECHHRLAYRTHGQTGKYSPFFQQSSSFSLPQKSAVFPSERRDTSQSRNPVSFFPSILFRWWQYLNDIFGILTPPPMSAFSLSLHY